MSFRTFEQVVVWYEQTKPIISKNHTKDDDVRPIAARDRKWERIKKIDDNTYALCDGNYGNTLWASQNTPIMNEYENTMAPITWMRREDGDFIRIRNHNKNNMTVTRYNFLHYHLPNALRFGYNQQGKHWVRHNGEDLPLPKCNVGIITTAPQQRELHDDNIYLMFRANEDGTFTRVGDMLKVEVQKVDIELKKQWRERLDSFYGYCAAIAPMIDVGWNGRNEYANMIREHLNNTPGGNLRGAWVRNASSVPTEVAREIMSDDQHPLRVAYAALVIHDIEGKRAINSQDDVRAIRAAYNRIMNKSLGFYKIEEK